MPSPRACGPTVIIGAGRSGTNMLRDLLTRVPGCGTWPCDEINYIWRHGNARHPTDEFPAEFARDEVRAFIAAAFGRLARRRGLRQVVEKTCANSLRVPFVDRILTDARYIHIIRDGRDVAVSAAERWRAPFEPLYILRKARFVPPRDLPYYATRYVANRLHRLLSRESRLSIWGPRFDGMQEVFARHPLHVGCAIQWQRCTEAAKRDLARVAADRTFTVRYEDFVSRPAEQFAAILSFLSVEAPPSLAASLCKGVSPRSVGRWRRVLPPETVRAIEAQVGPALREMGYDD